jgi:hypothetical protein
VHLRRGPAVRVTNQEPHAIAIRDDDTSYFTHPCEIEAVYAPLGGSVRVSLAVTPFAVECHFRGDPVRFRQNHSPAPLNANAELVAYLRHGIQSGRWSILCHGYTHAYLRDAAGALIPECVWKSDARLGREAIPGKRHLEETLGCEVRAYVPPGNNIRLSAIRAIGRNFPHVLATVPARRWREFLLHPSGAGILARRIAHELIANGPNPRAERFGETWLLPSLSLTASGRWEDLVHRFTVCRRIGADLILAVHYWELQGAVRDLFYRFLDFTMARGAVFAHCDELFPADEFPLPEAAPQEQCGPHDTPRRPHRPKYVEDGAAGRFPVPARRCRRLRRGKPPAPAAARRDARRAANAAARTARRGAPHPVLEMRARRLGHASRALHPRRSAVAPLPHKDILRERGTTCWFQRAACHNFSGGSTGIPIRF